MKSKSIVASVVLAICMRGSENSVCLQQAANRIVSSADYHGDWEHAFHLLKSLGIVNDNEQWVGGNTTYVQTGDVVDRGPDGKRLYELLFRLQDAAPASGGRVVLIVGNHELMCMQGNQNYVSNGDFAAYGGRSAHLSAWGANGAIGSELRKRAKLAAIVSDVIYVHGGLLPRMLCDVANSANLSDLNALAKQLFAGSAQSIAQSSSPLLGSDGPMWTRYLALENEGSACSALEKTLSLLGVRRMIVGHTIQSSGDVTPICVGRLLLSDTMMSQAYTQDAAQSLHNEAALEFFGTSEVVQAVYPGRTDRCASLPEVTVSTPGSCSQGHTQFTSATQTQSSAFSVTTSTTSVSSFNCCEGTQQTSKTSGNTSGAISKYSLFLVLLINSLARVSMC